MQNIGSLQQYSGCFMWPVASDQKQACVQTLLHGGEQEKCSLSLSLTYQFYWSHLKEVCKAKGGKCPGEFRRVFCLALFPPSCSVVQVEMSNAPSCEVLWDQFQLVTPDDTDKKLACCKDASSPVYLCPSWFVKFAKNLDTEWATEIINASLWEGHLPSYLKRQLYSPLLNKKSNLLMAEMNKFRPVANISFMGKLIKRVSGRLVASVLGWHL